MRPGLYFTGTVGSSSIGVNRRTIVQSGWVTWCCHVYNTTRQYHVVAFWSMMGFFLARLQFKWYSTSLRLIYLIVSTRHYQEVQIGFSMLCSKYRLPWTTNYVCTFICKYTVCKHVYEVCINLWFANFMLWIYLRRRHHFAGWFVWRSFRSFTCGGRVCSDASRCVYARPSVELTYTSLLSQSTSYPVRLWDTNLCCFYLCDVLFRYMTNAICKSIIFTSNLCTA